MEAYVADKMVIFEAQEPGQTTVLNLDDPWQEGFSRATRAAVVYYSASALPEGAPGAWLTGEAGLARLSPAAPPRQLLGASLLAGRHNRMNLLCAGLAMLAFGVKVEVIRKALAEFPGIEHRMELVRTWHGIRFYNDSAATIPHATAEALRSLAGRLVLITGGTDKNLDFSPIVQAARIPAAILLLKGTGTEKLRTDLEAEGVAYEGPFESLAEAVGAAVDRAAADADDTGVTVLFSPGCTSFGMFLNEFDRGRKFKEIVAGLGEADRALP
jgi:UDP-N-acetylmuramoylalanine--D-glutamate ligase